MKFGIALGSLALFCSAEPSAFAIPQGTPDFESKTSMLQACAAFSLQGRGATQVLHGRPGGSPVVMAKIDEDAGGVIYVAQLEHESVQFRAPKHFSGTLNVHPGNFRVTIQDGRLEALIASNNLRSTKFPLRTVRAMAATAEMRRVASSVVRASLANALESFPMTTFARLRESASAFAPFWEPGALGVPKFKRELFSAYGLRSWGDLLRILKGERIDERNAWRSRVNRQAMRFLLYRLLRRGPTSSEQKRNPQAGLTMEDLQSTLGILGLPRNSTEAHAKLSELKRLREHSLAPLNPPIDPELKNTLSAHFSEREAELEARSQPSHFEDLLNHLRSFQGHFKAYLGMLAPEIALSACFKTGDAEIAQAGDVLLRRTLGITDTVESLRKDVTSAAGGD